MLPKKAKARTPITFRKYDSTLFDKIYQKAAKLDRPYEQRKTSEAAMEPPKQNLAPPMELEIENKLSHSTGTSNTAHWIENLAPQSARMI